MFIEFVVCSGIQNMTKKYKGLGNTDRYSERDRDAGGVTQQEKEKSQMWCVCAPVFGCGCPCECVYKPVP